MAKQKLTVIITYSDNTQSSDNSDMQEYAAWFASYYPNFVNQLAQNMIGSWDMCDVTLEKDGETFRAHTEGNRHENDTEYAEGVTGNPWHDCNNTQPPHEGNVLLAVNEDNDKEWEYIPAYWREGEYYRGWNAVRLTNVYKHAYWRYIDAPQLPITQND